MQWYFSKLTKPHNTVYNKSVYKTMRTETDAMYSMSIQSLLIMS